MQKCNSALVFCRIISTIENTSQTERAESLLLLQGNPLETLRLALLLMLLPVAVGIALSVWVPHGATLVIDKLQ